MLVGGLFVVAGAFLLHAVSYGARYSFGIFVQPLTEENGWSRTVISLAASLSTFALVAAFESRTASPGVSVSTAPAK